MSDDPKKPEPLPKLMPCPACGKPPMIEIQQGFLDEKEFFQMFCCAQRTGLQDTKLQAANVWNSINAP